MINAPKMSLPDKDRIKQIMSQNGFLGLRKPLEQAGFKVDDMETFSGMALKASKKNGGAVWIASKKMFEEGKFDFETPQGIVMTDAD